MRNKRNVLLIGLLLALALVSAFAVMRPQKATSEQTAAEKQFAKLDAELPIVDFTSPEPTDAKQLAKRAAQAKRYNRARQNVGPETTVTVYIYHWPEGFTALPADLSDVVLIGEVTEARAVVSADKSTVFSEFSIKVEASLKDLNSEISVGKTVIAEREGGRVRFPSGFISRYFVSDFGMPQPGTRYLFFLKKLTDTDDYSILTGYELREGHIVPLDRSPGVVKFQKYAGMDESSFLSAVTAEIDKLAISSKKKVEQ